MMRACLLLVVVAGTASAQGRQQLIAASRAQGPHLVIVDAELQPTGTCAPGAAMLEVHAVVANRGDRAFGGAPDYGLVGADLDKFGSMLGNGGTVPKIAAGASVEIVFPIYYPVGQPQLVTKTMRYELKLDRYARFPAEQMDPHIVVRTVSPQCSSAQLAR
jgi:hypothetical protein